MDDTYAQKFGHRPARYPPFPPSLPADCHVLMYGDLTANGSAGGRAGEKVDDPAACTADTKEATRRPKRCSCIVNGPSRLGREADAFITDSKQGGDRFQRDRRSTFIGMLEEAVLGRGCTSAACQSYRTQNECAGYLAHGAAS